MAQYRLDLYLELETITRLLNNAKYKERTCIDLV
jgi:hypothetical protein